MLSHIQTKLHVGTSKNNEDWQIFGGVSDVWDANRGPWKCLTRQVGVFQFFR